MKFLNKAIKKIRAKLRLQSVEEVFVEIYETNHWGDTESISGPGSSFTQTKTVIGVVSDLIPELNIKSILDIPCGDFNWMQKVNLKDVQYLGCDIVDELLKVNISKFRSDKIEFKKLEILSEKLPKVDLIICRDLLVHFSFKHAEIAIRNILDSESKYLLTTIFPDRDSNHDIKTGNWRPLKLMIPPFNFPKPIKIFNEKCTEENGKFSDKSLGLWEISSLK